VDVVTAFLNAGSSRRSSTWKQLRELSAGGEGVSTAEEPVWAASGTKAVAQLCEELGVMGFEASSADPALFTLHVPVGFHHRPGLCR
jgi:hypothetical protein